MPDYLAEAFAQFQQEATKAILEQATTNAS